MGKLSQAEALQLVRESANEFGFRPNSDLEFVKYRENIVFRLVDDSDGQSYVVRLHRPGHRTDQQIQTENSYLRLLHEAGLSVSRGVDTRDDRLFSTVTDHKGNAYQVDSQHWVPESSQLGDASDAWLGLESPTVGSFKQLGELAGKFHKISQKLGKIDGFERDPWDLEGLVGENPLWGDPRRLTDDTDDREAIDQAMKNIRKQLEDLGTAEDVYGVIHADFSPENVLISGDDLTLIDFDDFGEGWWIFDLATVLFWYHRHPQATELREALLSGYQQYFPIVPKAFEMLDAFILARALTYLGWAADRPTNETSAFLRAEVLPVVVELCKKYNEKFLDGVERNV